MEAANPAAQASAPVRDRGAVARLKSKFERQNMIAVLVLFAAALAFPYMPGVEGWMASQASLVIIYIMAAQGVSILTGYTGIVTVGHGGFLAIGAYTSALLTKYFAVDLVIGLLGGAVLAGLIGCVLALIFLRLAGAFMAIGGALRDEVLDRL